MDGLILLRGRIVVAGTGRGAAVVSDEPLSYWGGVDPATGEVIDRRHPLSGQLLPGRVLVLPHGRGSCSASGVLLESIRNGTAPAAILTARTDPILGLGAILGDELYGRPVPVAVLEPDAFAAIRTGDAIAIFEDGAIELRPLNEQHRGAVASLPSFGSSKDTIRAP